MQPLPTKLSRELFSLDLPEMVGAVGIELKAALKTRKLLILLNEKNAKYTGIAQLRYTRGIRDRGE